MPCDSWSLGRKIFMFNPLQKEIMTRLTYSIIICCVVFSTGSCRKAASGGETITSKTQIEKPPQGLVLINIDPPKPMFVGTPQNVSVQRLKKPSGKPRPLFYAPAGTINISTGKPVTSSDGIPIVGELTMITDGNKNALDGYYVELGPFDQHITIDLKDSCEIYAIVVWHFHLQPRVYYDVIVQISDTPDFKNTTTVFNNDHDNSLGFGHGNDMHYTETSEGKLIDAKGNHGRYIRLFSNGNTSNDLNHYIEVEVFGKPLNEH